jgi:hypothetical protein
MWARWYEPWHWKAGALIERRPFGSIPHSAGCLRRRNDDGGAPA